MVLLAQPGLVVHSVRWAASPHVRRQYRLNEGASRAGLRRRLAVCAATSAGLNEEGKLAGTNDYLAAMDVNSPVPATQRPILQLRELQDSGFFSWAELPLPAYALRLVGVWMATVVFLGVPIACGTYNLASQPVQVGLSSGASALVVVTGVVLRLFLGWDYVRNRLLSATVEYEETGWYDGQVWVKPQGVLARDRLVGNFQIKPAVDRVRTTLNVCAACVVTVSCLLQYFLPSPVTPVDLDALPPEDPSTLSYNSQGGDNPRYSGYGDDAHKISHQIFLSYRNQLDYEDVARTYEPWDFEDEDGNTDPFDPEDSTAYNTNIEKMKQSVAGSIAGYPYP